MLHNIISPMTDIRKGIRKDCRRSTVRLTSEGKMEAALTRRALRNMVYFSLNPSLAAIVLKRCVQYLQIRPTTMA